MSKIIFDTAIGSTNLGDHIIMDAVHQITETLFPDEFLLQIATHQRIHPLDLPTLRKFDMAVVGGTNLLKNDNIRYSQWKVGLKELAVLKHKVVLLGVGWWQYQNQPLSPYSRFLYRQLLAKQWTHSVRDSYTLNKLASAGIHNVLNTGCPTVWSLDAEHCRQIPVEKCDTVVTTITDYLRDPERDRQMLETLKAQYKEVHLWLQGSKDLEYVRQLCDGVEIIPPKLAAFDDFLESRTCDYIGTRLHAGIRALQKKRRSLIIGIDNRALEMQKDIGIQVLARTDMDALPTWIHQQHPVELRIHWEAIETWKSQFTIHSNQQASQ